MSLVRPTNRLGRAGDSSSSAGSSAVGGVTSGGLAQIPRPSVPGVLTNPQLQDISVYKALRSLINTTAANSGLASFGSVATTASDGKPATYNQGQLDSTLIRVLPAGSTVTGVNNYWVAGGGDTDIKHGLGRIPIGYIVVRTSQGVAVSDGATAWTATDIYFKVDHSDTDATLMIF